ncbi:unnamed protein product, partial [Didymodactylos carnosus]
FTAEKTITVLPGQSKTVEFVAGWEGRAQKLTGASNEPATWAEFHFNAWNDMTFGDISYIRGNNGAMVMTSEDGSMKSGTSENLIAEAPASLRKTDSSGTSILDATEPYTGGKNNALIQYYRSKVQEGQGYIEHTDDKSAHGTTSKQLKLDVY